jgi:uncharacterized protein involved in exopolysaccharide biosynthesis
VTNPEDKDEITLSEITGLVWGQKWLVIGITLLFAAASIAYAKLAQEWWRSETLLVASEQKGAGLAGSLGALSGLAGIAGINLDGAETAEPIATLTSKEFIAAFIEDENLLPVLFAEQWNAAAKQWTGEKKSWPDVRDGIRLFQRKILGVDEDAKTKLVTVSVTWTDAQLATKWANMLVERLNARMRDRALRDAERNVSYLRQELTTADVVTLQESVARLLEREMQKMMVARGNPEYSFRVVDRASVPKWRSSPKRVQVVILGTMAGGLVAIFLAVFLGRSRTRRTAHA